MLLSLSFVMFWFALSRSNSSCRFRQASPGAEAPKLSAQCSLRFHENRKHVKLINNFGWQVRDHCINFLQFSLILGLQLLQEITFLSQLNNAMWQEI